MTQPAGSQTPPGQGSQGQAPAGTSDPEAGRIKGLDERFTKIETEQHEQRGILDQILQKVSGGSPPTAGKGGAPAAGGDPGPGAPPQDIGEMMRQAVRDVGAETAAQQAKAKHDAEHARIAELSSRRAEQAPREQRTPWRARIQKRMWGVDE